jgi:glycerophosphoryl diester phosphodiesterase
MDTDKIRKTAIAGFLLSAALLCAARPANLINLADRAALAREHPFILIAHRGGFVTPESPEGSLRAIRLAAENGFDMVELDIHRSSDFVPVIFHDPNLMARCGVPGVPSDYTVEKLKSLHLGSTDQTISTLDEALTVCRESGLGIQMDFKVRDQGPDLERVAKAVVALVESHGLARAAVTISNDNPILARFLEGKAMFSFGAGDLTARLQSTSPPTPDRWYLFDVAGRTPDDAVQAALGKGFLVIPAVNTFRYSADRMMGDAKKDVDRLIGLGVSGFQIDSVFLPLLPHDKVAPKPRQ